MTTSLYNGRGNVIETTDAIGNTVSTTYDKRDLPLTKTVTPIGWAAANTTTYVYDDDGRIISEEDELTNETTYVYNSLNQVTRITDALGHNKDFTYDYLSRKTSETEVASGTTITTGYGYDERWNLTSVTDGEGNITIYSYDAANRNTDVTYEDATSITMTYDKNSNLATRTDAMGTLITNTYDDMNRLTARSITTGTWVSGVTSESYTYDPLEGLLQDQIANLENWALRTIHSVDSRVNLNSHLVARRRHFLIAMTLAPIWPASRIQIVVYRHLAMIHSIVILSSTSAGHPSLRTPTLASFLPMSHMVILLRRN
jgi:YD repeat-containing protein